MKGVRLEELSVIKQDLEESSGTIEFDQTLNGTDDYFACPPLEGPECELVRLKVCWF